MNNRQKIASGIGAFAIAVLAGWHDSYAACAPLNDLPRHAMQILGLVGGAAAFLKAHWPKNDDDMLLKGPRP